MGGGRLARERKCGPKTANKIKLGGLGGKVLDGLRVWTPKWNQNQDEGLGEGGLKRK